MHLVANDRPTRAEPEQRSVHARRFDDAGRKIEVTHERFVSPDGEASEVPFVGAHLGNRVHHASGEAGEANVEGRDQDLVLGHGVEGQHFRAGLAAWHAARRQPERVLVAHTVDEHLVVAVVLARDREATVLRGRHLGGQERQLHDVS